MEYLEDILILVTRAAILIFECIGVGVITFSGLQGIVNYIRRKPNTRLILAKGLSMGPVSYTHLDYTSEDPERLLQKSPQSSSVF